MKAAFVCLGLLLSLSVVQAQDVSFRTQEIATDLKIGYAVLIEDINQDGKPDIVVVDKHRVVWYENPSWKVRTILQGKTKPDNVCITATDVDKDGTIDLILGADWAPFNTKQGGTLQWLKRGKTLDEEWTLYPIGEEPTVHRVRMFDADGSGVKQILLGPLMGRESTREKNWMDGRAVRMLAFTIPEKPMESNRWKAVPISEELHVVHNFVPVSNGKGKPDAILAASYEGVSWIEKKGDKWTTTLIGTGNQDNPKSNRGASEIKLGRLKNGAKVIATIEPWHGNQVVVYTEPKQGQTLWKRHMIDDHLRWGHAVSFADLDGDGNEELIIGVRDNPAKGDSFQEKCGVRVYQVTDANGSTWKRQIVENGGVAVEDLAVADLNGDGKPDLVAVGRATGNARIYWNQP